MIYNKSMNEEKLNLVLDILNEKTQQNFTIQKNAYESLYENLQAIIDTNFVDVQNKLFVLPCGDYFTHTFYDNSIVDFYVIFKTNKDEIDFSIVDQKITKKGKKANTYSQIMNRPMVSGSLQAEDIAKRLSDQILGTIKTLSIFQKRNQIMLRLNGDVIARITVCYDFSEPNGELTCRNVNIWKQINPVKYLEKIDKKRLETDNNFELIARLFKALEMELVLNQESNIIIGKNYFVENLLFNVPSELFKSDSVYNTIYKILAFLRLKDYKTFRLIDETDFMYKQDFYSKNYAKQFINKIEYALENLDELLK